jgi:hypothetical protein
MASAEDWHLSAALLSFSGTTLGARFELFVATADDDG